MNINVSGRIWPARRHDSDKTRAVKCCPVGGIFTKDCECCAGFCSNNISVFFGRSLGSL